MPDVLDLTQYRAPAGVSPDSPLQEGEVAMPEAAAEPPAAPEPQAPVIDETVVAQLLSMGFSENGCRRAAQAAGANVEAASEWIFAHMEDADFNDPLPEPGAAAPSGEAEVNPETLMMLTSMGFSEAQVIPVLKHTNGDAERAADWLFSHSDDLDGSIAALSGDAAAASSTPSGSGPRLDDGPGVYKLRGFVSHVGRNTGSGHYVAHIRKHIPSLGEERWVIFNDQSVALSERPPREHAYLYLYERADA